MAKKILKITNKLNVALVIIITIIALSLSACLPVEDESVNAELFKSKEDLKTLAEKLEPGMLANDVFSQINIPTEKFNFMSTEELQRTIYGNSLVQGSPYELEIFKEKLLTYKGYYIPYKSIESEGSLGLGKMKVNKKGHDLRFILIFENGILLKATVDGAPNINHHEDKYMWNTLLEKGAGFAF